jgi:hypothetical protein
MDGNLVNEQDFKQLIEKRARMLLTWRISRKARTRGILTALVGGVVVVFGPARGTSTPTTPGKLHVVHAPCPHGDAQAVFRRQLKALHIAIVSPAIGSFRSNGILSPPRTRPWSYQYRARPCGPGNADSGRGLGLSSRRSRTWRPLRSICRSAAARLRGTQPRRWRRCSPCWHGLL